MSTWQLMTQQLMIFQIHVNYCRPKYCQWFLRYHVNKYYCRPKYCQWFLRYGISGSRDGHLP